jgi:hypothetical protein
MRFVCKQGEISIIHQKVALFQNSDYSFCMSREFHFSVPALLSSLLPSLLLSLLLLR